jgi:hypothetical protein
MWSRLRPTALSDQVVVLALPGASPGNWPFTNPANSASTSFSSRAVASCTRQTGRKREVMGRVEKRDSGESRYMVSNARYARCFSPSPRSTNVARSGRPIQAMSGRAASSPRIWALMRGPSSSSTTPAT